LPSGDEISFLKRELNQKKIYNDMAVTLGDERPSFSTVKNWAARFRTGHLSTEGEECSGTSSRVTIPENVDAIHSIILDD
jgi:hypothetical protein